MMMKIPVGGISMYESGEMYLETILILGLRRNLVRAVDVAEEMGLSKPSVSRALGKLKAEECIIVDENGHIAFTDGAGRAGEDRSGGRLQDGARHQRRDLRGHAPASEREKGRLNAARSAGARQIAARPLSVFRRTRRRPPHD